MIFAASIKFFDGKQPRFTHVPPMVRSSVMTAVLPSSRARNAAAKAVEPEPRITRSNLSARIISPVFLECGDPDLSGLLKARTCPRTLNDESRFPRQRAHAAFDCFFQKFQLFLVEIFSRNSLANIFEPACRLSARAAGDVLVAGDAFAPCRGELMLKLLSFLFRQRRLRFNSANQSRGDDAGFFFA